MYGRLSSKAQACKVSGAGALLEVKGGRKEIPRPSEFTNINIQENFSLKYTTINNDVKVLRDFLEQVVTLESLIWGAVGFNGGVA